MMISKLVLRIRDLGHPPPQHSSNFGANPFLGGSPYVIPPHLCCNFVANATFRDDITVIADALISHYLARKTQCQLPYPGM